jgi:hypothetical protein
LAFITINSSKYVKERRISLSGAFFRNDDAELMFLNACAKELKNARAYAPAWEDLELSSKMPIAA